ncbi:MAG: SHOCT domain-containing protein [Pirellulales bacterium]
MSLSDEIRQLDDLRRSGALTQEEFDAAKRKLLDWPNDMSMSGQLEELKQQNAVAQLDREWELERENYMVRGKHGHRYLPSRAGSVIGGIFLGGFGCAWLAIADSMAKAGGLFAIFPLFGILFILFGVGMSAVSFVKAGKYEEAQERYQQRRRELLSRQSEDR